MSIVVNITHVVFIFVSVLKVTICLVIVWKSADDVLGERMSSGHRKRESNIEKTDGRGITKHPLWEIIRYNSRRTDSYMTVFFLCFVRSAAKCSWKTSARLLVSCVRPEAVVPFRFTRQAPDGTVSGVISNPPPRGSYERKLREKEAPDPVVSWTFDLVRKRCEPVGIVCLFICWFTYDRVRGSITQRAQWIRFDFITNRWRVPGARTWFPDYTTTGSGITTFVRVGRCVKREQRWRGKSAKNKQNRWKSNILRVYIIDTTIVIINN